jgi:hypothetical protein
MQEMKTAHKERELRIKGMDRRVSVRYLAEKESFAYSLGNNGDVCFTARIHDISRDGMGLIVSERVDPGTILNVELHGSAEGVPCFLLARVMWTRERGEGMLLVGCQFSRSLSESELRALL